MRTLLDIILWPWRYFKERREMKKRMEELRKRDPFIYK